jgi:hypothetical protein
MKTVVIHQPDFLPYLGFFDRFLKSDLWVVLDHVQFVNKGNSWHYRDKIKTPNGAQWLSTSIQKCANDTPINEVLLSNTVDWRTKNLNLLRQNYGKAPGFAEVFPYIEELYAYSCIKMADFNLRSIEMLMKLFDISIPSVFSSKLDPQGKKNELLIDILNKVGADIYLSGVGAKDYMEPDLFKLSGIDVVYQDYKHPVYTQLHGNFIPYLSSIDLFLNCGIDQARQLIRV